MRQAFATDSGRIQTIPQLWLRGHHRLQVAEWSREGLAERLLHGVYRDPLGTVPCEQCLHLPLRYLEMRRPSDCAPAIASGHAVLAAMGTPGFELPSPPLILVELRQRPRDNPSTHTIRRTDLAGVERIAWRGLDLTVAHRALADTALDVTVTDAVLRNALDHLRNTRQLLLHEAVEAWRSIPHDGARRLLAMYDAGVFDFESDGERSAFEALFVDHPPAPDCQVVLVGNLRCDFAFLSAALTIEYVGKVHDGRANEDSTRAFAIERIGHRTIRVSRSMIREPRPLMEHIHNLRREREHLISLGVLRRPPLPPQPPRRIPLRTLRPLG